MNCTKAKHSIISGELDGEAAQHIASCPSCRELLEKVDETMAMLDLKVTIPDGLETKILSNRNGKAQGATRRLEWITYFQIAAAVFLGIFIGHQFGRYAGPIHRTAAEDPLHQYFKAHHFNVEHPDFTSPTSFNFIKNE